MTENGDGEISGRKRRSSEEVRRLVAQFESSGLRQNEFCRNEGLSLAPWGANFKKRQLGKFEATHRGLVAVELARSSREGKRPVRSALEVVLSNGRRIEVWPDFDSGTLERLVGVLEKV